MYIIGIQGKISRQVSRARPLSHIQPHAISICAFARLRVNQIPLIMVWSSCKQQTIFNASGSLSIDIQQGSNSFMPHILTETAQIQNAKFKYLIYIQSFVVEWLQNLPLFFFSSNVISIIVFFLVFYRMLFALECKPDISSQIEMTKALSFNST